MNLNYNEVPNIISCKDLDYLSDMFLWNYASYKKNINSLNEIKDLEIKNIVEKASDIFNQNLNIVLDILSEGGQNE